VISDQYGRVELTEQEAFEALYTKKLETLQDICINNNTELFNSARDTNADKIPLLKKLEALDITVEQFDKNNQAQWFMPEEYRLYDIVDWLYSQCRTMEQKNRVTEELKLYAQHDMIMVLKYFKYLVDTMRKNKILWGVGRGSSVGSYVLFLIGAHKIDSMRYNLDINEFLR
jgi:DNA polymerase III alpha subunit